MSIISQLGKKISDAGQETAAKAKNFAELTKLYNSISDVQKRISDLYFQLGKEYFEKYKDNDEIEEKDLIERIKSSYREIEQYKEQIQKIKGVECCPNCGEEIAEGSVFCNRCGAKIIRASEENEGNDLKRCPKCQAIVGEEDLFCNSCGFKLITEE